MKYVILVPIYNDRVSLKLLIENINNQVKDLNTDSGKLRCQERKTKKGINKNNIKENLSKYLTETDKLNDAINDIWLNREEIISYKIKKCKN